MTREEAVVLAAQANGWLSPDSTHHYVAMGPAAGAILPPGISPYYVKREKRPR